MKIRSSLRAGLGTLVSSTSTVRTLTSPSVRTDGGGAFSVSRTGTLSTDGGVALA